MGALEYEVSPAGLACPMFLTLFRDLSFKEAAGFPTRKWRTTFDLVDIAAREPGHSTS
jgi:hypothetical protein